MRSSIHFGLSTSSTTTTRTTTRTQTRTMKRQKRTPEETREQTNALLEDGLYVLAHVPKIHVREIKVVVDNPHLLGLGRNPVVARTREGRLIARTSRRIRDRGGLTLTFQWEAPSSRRRAAQVSMSLAEFLEYQQKMVA